MSVQPATSSAPVAPTTEETTTVENPNVEAKYTSFSKAL
ncbi:MAG: hypothetical protein K1060chlam4_00758, partial [Candidatus Anoxychlamydiales bacterium]|nr:hypothetical protein [Candidatus Anoxychlamydiales bacterium]